MERCREQPRELDVHFAMGKVVDLEGNDKIDEPVRPGYRHRDLQLLKSAGPLIGGA